MQMVRVVVRDGAMALAAVALAAALGRVDVGRLLWLSFGERLGAEGLFGVTGARQVRVGEERSLVHASELLAPQAHDGEESVARDAAKYPRLVWECGALRNNCWNTSDFARSYIWILQTAGVPTDVSSPPQGPPSGEGSFGDPAGWRWELSSGYPADSRWLDTCCHFH